MTYIVYTGMGDEKMDNYINGLNDEEVNERVINGQTNKPVESGSKTVKQIIFENTFTYFNLIFTVLAILIIIVGSFRDLTFMPVIIANAVIGIVQEIKAKRIVDNLKMLSVRKVTAIRNGKKQDIVPQNLVVDDVVVFKAGDQICADAVVCEGSVMVNESLLTGESDEIEKTAGGSLMSGSFIISGECLARLEKVGEDSYISKLTIQAKKMQDTEQSEMIRSLDNLVKIVGIAIIPIGVILFIMSFFVQHDSFRESIVSMVAAVIGMIPEGLYLLASVALVVSTIRLASKKVLLHDMKCIETLARVNVLCVDKTGTITDNTMKVREFVNISNDIDNDIVEMEIGDFAKSQSKDNITMEAIKEFFKKNNGRKAVSMTGFSSVTKYSSVTFDDCSYVIGAPEFVLKEKFADYESDINEYASKGIRVVVFGKYNEKIDGGELKYGIEPHAYILLANPLRKSVKETFGYFKEQGVKIKVISGDNPVTVSEVARQAGIDNAEEYIDASTLETVEDMEQAILKYTVFGRVKPNQKREFVNALKKNGNTVAMTGDGVNDILALKDADCSIAMASGSEAAAQSAKLVLLDSDFSCMPDVVYEGRRVVNNIERSASLFLVKNIFSFVLSIYTMVLMITYPMKPSQISLISMFTIGIPGFFLAMEPNKNIIRGRFIPNVLLKALPAALTDVIAVGSLIIFGRTFGLNTDEVSTAATMLLAIVGFMILYRISFPLNKFRAGVWIGCVIGLLFCALKMSGLFALSGMSYKCIMLFVVFSVATESLFRYLSIFTEFVQNRINERKSKK